MRYPTLSVFAAATIALALSACASMRMDQVAGDLKTAEVGEPVVVTSREGTVTVTSNADYLYPSGGWDLRPNAPVLSKMAPTLAKLKNTNIIVAGYTDSTPIGPGLKQKGVTSNKELSYNRAVTVVDYLASQGVKRDLLSAQGYGEANPVASNDTPEGRAKNRRVEITLRGDGS
jgi:chemotaxis protein MotB